MFYSYSTKSLVASIGRRITYRVSSLMRGVSGDDPEGGAGSGVPRPRLVTAFPEGSGPRPPGITTWLRGVRCTDPQEMAEMEARPRAQNRHGWSAERRASRSQGTRPG